jgi:probable addiction module antidote protein
METKETIMSKSKLTKWDSAEYLKTDEDILHYIKACLEENDPELIPHALGVIARAQGMTQLSKKTGITREGLYKALSDEGNPEFSTVMKVFQGLGLKLTIQAA